MTTIRQKLIAKLHILLKQQGVEEHKNVIYASYGVDSSRNLTEAQLSDLISRLEGDKKQPAAVPAKVAVTPQIRALRSEILSLLTKSPRTTNPRRRGLGVPNDWMILNPFIERHAGAMMYNLTMEDLLAFKRKLCSMRDTGWSYKEKTEVEEPLVEQPTSEPRHQYPVIIRTPEFAS